MQITISQDDLYSMIKKAVKEVLSEEGIKIYGNKVPSEPGKNDPFLDYLTNDGTAVENRFNLTDISVNHDKYLY